ncbi:hypothetical protein D6779_10625, partial [Candidatus Parcubacteria bacterium]
AGEISFDEYRQLLVEICGEPSEDNSPHNSSSSCGFIKGALIYEFENLQLFENAIVFRNITYPLSDVTSVRGGQSQQSFNFVPTEKTSSMHIKFLSGDSISISEKRILFGGKRHDAISHLLATLRKMTFNQRLTNLTRKLIQQGKIELTTSWIIGGKEVGEVVTLNKNGTVSTPTMVVDLKVAKATGTFCLGSEWRSFNSMSFKINPYEVVLSEKKRMLGSMIPLDALRFVPFVEDVDVVHALLTWMAEPQTKLA